MIERSARAAWVRPMRPRDPAEPHRASTPLELLFDLCFVVAVAQASARLHHGLAEGHVAAAVASYGLVFFAIWWAWMNFTWFASAYDTDDVPYRLAVLLQMAGVLVLAAGIPRAFDGHDFTTVTVGYAIMRVGLVGLWLRAAHADPGHRRTALRYAAGLVACQIGWLGLLALPAHWWPRGFLVLAPAELLVPVWAERAQRTAWHPHHIAERYGLLTLIVLGESVLSATVAIQAAADAGAPSAHLLGVIVGGLLLFFALWWIYFDQPAHDLLVSTRVAFQWGYGHLPIFASLAAVGAGIGASADLASGRAHLSTAAAGAAVAIPVACYLLAVWTLHFRPLRRGTALGAACLLTVALVLAAAASAWAVLLIGLLAAALATVCVLTRPAAGAA